MKVEYAFTKINDSTYRPMLPVTILNPITGEKCNCRALLDTGADKSMLPRMVSTRAGYTIDSNTKPDGKCFGISGEPVNVWKNKFLIQLLDDTRTKIVKTSNVISVDCVSSNTAVPILGTIDFLKDFIVSLNYPKKTFTLEWKN